jgi:mannose-6-phosphate isomerase-like protein (cupin superfamily)
MSQPFVFEPGQVVGAKGVGFEMREWSHGPNDGPPMHVHDSDDEAWHVLEGTLRFRFSDRTVDVRAGGTVFAPAGTPHTYGNPGPGDVRYLIVTTSRLFAAIEAFNSETGPSDADLELVKPVEG